MNKRFQQKYSWYESIMNAATHLSHSHKCLLLSSVMLWQKQFRAILQQNPARPLIRNPASDGRHHRKGLAYLRRCSLLQFVPSVYHLIMLLPAGLTPFDLTVISYYAGSNLWATCGQTEPKGAAGLLVRPPYRKFNMKISLLLFCDVIQFWKTDMFLLDFTSWSFVQERHEAQTSL